MKYVGSWRCRNCGGSHASKEALDVCCWDVSRPLKDQSHDADGRLIMADPLARERAGQARLFN